MARLLPGTSKTNVFEMLRPFNVTVEEGSGTGQGHTVGYRLDDAWLLRCSYRNRGHLLDGTLIRSELIQRVRHVWVEPPTNFTGVWITYFANGQKAQEINYKDGRYSGEFIAYYSDGPKAYVQHYDRHAAEGPDTGFYRSGRTNYYGLYRTNKQVGTWTWYNEDGSIQSTRDFSHP